MLASLFGDLASLKAMEASKASSEDADQGFAATAVLEGALPPSFDVRARIEDPGAESLFVTGSPSQAIREHFNRTRADLDQAGHMVTLLDLTNERATALLKALSETTGAPLQRLQLREQATLRTLAVIERTSVERRGQDTLKVYHADARGSGSEESELSAALMERSQLTVVLLEGAAPDAVTDLLHRLQALVRLSTWRCPLLAFLLPPDAAALAAHVRGMAWPAGVRVEVLTQPVRGASALWNTLLSLWERRHEAPPLHRSALEAPDPALVRRLLGQLLLCEGVQGCALVDGAAGSLLAGEVSLPAGLAPDLTRAALACSLAMRAQQHAARQMNLPAVEEMTVTAGEHQHVVRTVAARPGLFLLALLDRKRTNVALARFKLREAERSLS